MPEIMCRFYGELNDFLPTAGQKQKFCSPFKGRESVKDKVEALGIPHTEVDVIVVNGQSVGFDYILENGDDISVYPWTEAIMLPKVTRLKRLPADPSRFVADINIRDVVKTMRSLGLDVLEDPTLSAKEIIDISLKDGRIILSGSRQLLKRKRVAYGIFIRRDHREAQIQRIIKMLSLKSHCSPFTRCFLCNTNLEKVSKESVWKRIPPRTRRRCNTFARCPSCDRLYWNGTHYQKIRAKVDRILAISTSGGSA
jgi:uncharacterized protein with PIN domain